MSVLTGLLIHASLIASEAEMRRLSLISEAAVKSTDQPAATAAKLTKALKPLLSSKDPMIRVRAGLLAGDLALRQGDCAGAASCFEAVRAQQALAPPEMVGMAGLGLAQALIGLRRHVEAQALLEGMIPEKIVQGSHEELLPVAAARDLARLLRDVGQLADAEAAAVIALDRNRRRYQSPEDPIQITDAELQALLDEIRDLRLVASDGPDALLFRRGMRAWEQGRDAEALTHLDELIARFPDTTHRDEAELTCARALIRQSQWPLGKARLLAWIGADPSGPWRGQGVCELCDGMLVEDLDPESAMSLVSGALTSSQTAVHASWPTAVPELRLRLGLLKLLDRDLDGARSEFLAAQPPKEPEGSRLLPPGWVPIPSSAELLAGLTNQSGQFVPDAALCARQPKANLAILLGQIAFVGRQWPLAERLFRRISDGDLRAEPMQTAFAIYRLSECRYWQDDPEEALRLYDRMIVDHPRSPWTDPAVIRKGIALQSQFGKRTEAIAVMQDLIKRRPHSTEVPAALWLLGSLYRWDSNRSMAIATYEQLNREFPGNPWKQYIVTTLLPELRASELQKKAAQ